jgi:ankyrin repeat protein
MEMLLGTTVQFMSIFVTAIILGTLFQYLLAKKDPLKEAYNKRMENLERFMTERRLPNVTRKRLKNYFQFQYHKARGHSSLSGGLNLPPALYVKVANARYRPTLVKCCVSGQGRICGALFGCSDQFLDSMVTKLRAVFLVPGDQFMRASDMVLELCFVIRGHAEVMDGETVKSVIRSDVDQPSIVGEVSFFLGVQQQYAVRAPTSSDIELLVLSKEASVVLFRDYPEQQEIIHSNLLRQFNIDEKGNDLETDVQGDEEDADRIKMRQTIKDTVKRRNEQAFNALVRAGVSGDFEEVRRMLRKGVDVNQANYDGRTVLHMAAVEGNYRVVELLLNEGADKNAHDRWGNTALQDSINHHQGPVTVLLANWGATLNNDNIAERLCNASAAGDIDALKLMVQNGANVNACDYDLRTALHVGAASSQGKCVEYLIQRHADCNAVDRWGSTPLQDAVNAGNSPLAEYIITQDGKMNPAFTTACIVNAGGDGNVWMLKLLIRCGTSPDTSDYDYRTPLHLAASQARLLAVSYLLGVR